MRMVLLGGAPGIGKTAAARRLLRLAANGPVLTQWVDVDALWLHQPWRVDDAMVAMVRANLRAVIANAEAAGVKVLVVTWVFQDASFHELLAGLAPTGVEVTTVQLRADEADWRQRFGSDPERPGIDEFFLGRYQAAQRTPADHVIDTDGMDPDGTAAAVAAALGW